MVRERRAYFLIVGDGHLRPGLEKRADQLGIREFIRFLGSRQDVNQILGGSDFAVNTSDSEGLSNSILEAMRAGLPIVASNVPGNRDLLENGINGLLFEKGNPEDLAKNLLYLMNEANMARKMVENNLERINKYFTIEKMIDKHICFYKTLIGSNHD